MSIARVCCDNYNACPALSTAMEFPWDGTVDLKLVPTLVIYVIQQGFGKLKTISVCSQHSKCSISVPWHRDVRF